MHIDITTPSILFPAISLFMLAFTNRFSAIVSRIRELSEKSHENKSESLLKQISYLERRVKFIIFMQAFLILSIIFCIISIFALIFSFELIGKWLFMTSLVFIAVSLFISFFEIQISTKAIDIQLEEMKKQN